MNYFIKTGSACLGPLDESKILEKVQSGFFKETDYISTNRKDWHPLNTCLTLLRERNTASEARQCEKQPTVTPSSPTVTPPPATPQPATPQPQAQELPNNPPRPTCPPPIQPSVQPNVPPRPLRPLRAQVPFQPKSTATPIRPRPIATPQPFTPSQSKPSKTIGILVTLLILLLITSISIIGYLLTRHSPQEITPLEPHDFTEVCQQYGSAVGLITVTFETHDGEFIGDYPLGTAFAIDNHTFVTNCHVVYGLKEFKTNFEESVLEYFKLSAAKEAGITTHRAYQDYCQQNKKDFDELRTIIQNNLQIRTIEIRLAHSGGQSLTVTKLQIHPRYNNNPDNSDYLTNQEYDVALLTTAQSTLGHFKLAPQERLFTLKQGEAIAYMGFPMEGLQDSGELDIHHPEATFKSGTINRITDFSKRFSRPEDNKFIVHDIPAAGGASGSPIFLPNGEVIAVLWGVSHIGRNADGDRIASAAQQNMAVRIDSIDNVKYQSKRDILQWLQN